MLSRVFNLAIDFKNAEMNPCSRVRKFKLDNERYRYVLPEEEPLLLNVMEGKRAHLRPQITGAAKRYVFATSRVSTPLVCMKTYPV